MLFVIYPSSNTCEKISMKFKSIRHRVTSVVPISVISKMDITEIEITKLGTYII